MAVDSGRKVEYFLCGSQRSGSNLLCEVLSRSGVAGRPTEHFVPAFPEAEVLGHGHAGFEKSVWARTRGLISFPEFFSAVVGEGSSPNQAHVECARGLPREARRVARLP